MKKFLSFVLVACMSLVFFSASAEENGITWHSAFGLSEGCSADDLTKAIERTFSVSPSSVSKNNYYPKNKYFYGLPIQWIIKDATDSSYPARNIEIAFEEECLTAENIRMLYQVMCTEFGDPVTCSIPHEIITINGKEEVQLSVDDLAGIQSAIDQFSLNKSIICWDNISISFYSRTSSSGEGMKHIEFDAAFSVVSIQNDIRKYYGLTN